MQTPASPFPEWLGREERLAPRAEAGAAAMVSGPRVAAAAAEVTDVSPLGCRVRTAAAGGVGAYLTLESGGVSVGGWVAWRRGEMLGLDFAAPLDAGALAALGGS